MDVNVPIALNNAAGRLYQVLAGARSQRNDVITHRMWANVFNIPNGSLHDVLRKLILIQSLSTEVRAKISGLTNVNSLLFLAHHHNIDSVLNVSNFDVHWSSFKPFLDDATMLGLAHCADKLSCFDEKPIPADELVSLNDDITRLFEKVLNGSFDDGLKDLILDLLETARRAIAEYNIRGAKGMRDDLAYILGKIIQNHNTFERDSSSEDLGIFWQIISRLDNLTTIAVNAVSLAPNIIKFFPAIISAGSSSS